MGPGFLFRLTDKKLSELLRCHMKDDELLDNEHIESLKSLSDADGPDIFQELLDIYKEQAPTVLMNLEKAIQAKDGKAIASESHKFKGSSGNMGAIGLFKCCDELEHLGINNKI